MFCGGGGADEKGKLFGGRGAECAGQVKALWSRTPKDFYVFELKIKSREKKRVGKIKTELKEKSSSVSDSFSCVLTF